jgi:hypothetical protein
MDAGAVSEPGSGRSALGLIQQEFYLGRVLGLGARTRMVSACTIEKYGPKRISNHLSIMTTYFPAILVFISLGALALALSGSGGAPLLLYGNGALSSSGGMLLILLAAKMVWSQSTSKDESSNASLVGPIVIGLLGALLHSSGWAIGLGLGLIGAMALYGARPPKP